MLFKANSFTWKLLNYLFSKMFTLHNYCVSCSINICFALLWITITNSNPWQTYSKCPLLFSLHLAALVFTSITALSIIPWSSEYLIQYLIPCQTKENNERDFTEKSFIVELRFYDFIGHWEEVRFRSRCRKQSELLT